jgi:corrinoid protein of di/trimethylamine methyltransferase
MFEDLQNAVISGADEEALSLTNKYLEEKKQPEQIIKEGLVAGMNVVGKRFKAYEMYLPEVIMSANAMKKSMEVLKPLISESNVSSMGKIVMATIEGDLHDIGKNLVSMMLEGAGFEIIDLGTDVPISKIVDAAIENKVRLVGISALLTTTMLAMEPAVKEIKNRDSSINVMVGGAPITIDFSKKIGADGFAPDALRAIDLAKKLLNISE